MAWKRWGLHDDREALRQIGHPGAEAEEPIPVAAHARAVTDLALDYLHGGIAPIIFNLAAIGTAVGALPGVGSTLAATLGYASSNRDMSSASQAECSEDAREAASKSTKAAR